MLNKFVRNLLIGLSAMVLLAGAQQGVFGSNILGKGPQAVLAVQACTETGDHYTQCGGNCNGVTFDNSHTVDVTKSVDSSCNVSWSCQDLGVKVGECNNNPPAPAAPAQPAPSCEWTFLRNECTSCNKARTVQKDCNGNTRISAENVDDSGCSAASRPDLCPAQAPPPTQAPRPAAPSCSRQDCTVPVSESTCQSGKIVFCKKDAPECGGQGCNCMVDTGSTCAAPAQTSQPSQPSQPSQTAAPQEQQQQVQAQITAVSQTNNQAAIVAPAQGAVAPASITNNNTNNNSSSSTVTVTNPTPQVVLAQAAPVTVANVGTGTSAVAGVQVQQLPKTGLPALAWSALAFVPAGFKMRRFSKVKRDLEDEPTYIWEERKFNTERS